MHIPYEFPSLVLGQILSRCLLADALGLLRLVHGTVSGRQQCVSGCAVFRIDGDAQARLTDEPMLFDQERLLEAAFQAADNRR